MTRNIWIHILAAAALGATCSCSRVDHPPTAPVRGRVLMGGRPLAGVTVMFLGDSAPRPSVGATDADGRFTLTTYDRGDGAVLGHNVVTIAPLVAPPPETAGRVPDPEAYFRVLKRSGKEPATNDRVPARYADMRKSGLEVVVKPGRNEPTIELK
jgi:hypothetical protein